MPSRTIVVGIGAGIAAYKAAVLVREFQRAGHTVHIVPTPASLEFVGRATWEGLSGASVRTSVFEGEGADHVELARIADLIVVAPATADLLARIRAGMANDLLTTTILAARCPLVVAPAMHTQMWNAAATQSNMRALIDRGVHVIGPDAGALGSGDTGVGRLVEPERIAEQSLRILEKDRIREAADEHAIDRNNEQLASKTVRVVVTAGGTREAIDPVRFIGNFSSGRQGIALAQAAHQRGWDVELISANIDESLLQELPSHIAITRVVSGHDLEQRVVECARSGVDVIIMAAAVADFRPVHVASEKIKKEVGTMQAPTIELERTTDILALLSTHPHRPRLLVGFAAETGDDAQVQAMGKEKAKRKGADLLAINAVGQGRGFGDVSNRLVVVDREGAVVNEISGSKNAVGCGLMALIAERLDIMTR